MPHTSSKPYRLPFQGLSKKEWINLVLLAVAVYYVIKPLMETFFKNTYTFLGGDFLSFWSAGWLANQRGYIAAYDPSQLAEIQYLYIPKPEDVSNYRFFPVITFFLPVFLLIFQALAKIPLTPSFVLWSLVNFFGYIGYLIFFARSLTLPIRLRDILLCCLFWPFFQSLFWGQIGVILVVAAGEFYRAFILSKHLRAGFWLGILMIKPQTLILILSVLLFQRQWKILLGFFFTISALVVVSLILITSQGIQAILALSDELANGYPTIVPEGMLNWRMIGENLSILGFPRLGWAITWVGILSTLTFVAIHFIGRQISPKNADLAFLVIFTATGLVSWHYHIHSAIIIIPFLLYLIAKDRESEFLILIWVIAPFAVLFLTDFLGVIIKITQGEFYQKYPALLYGLCGLVLSLATTVRAAIVYRKSFQRN